MVVNEQKKRIYLSAPHMSGREQDYIGEAFADNWIAPVGPHVDAFEQEMAKHVGAFGAAAVSSGTAAIHLALRLLQVNHGDRVFCSTLTFIASANPILYMGGEVVLIDSEPQTWNMSPQALETALKDAELEGALPKAVIVVHLYGQCARMDEILTLCGRYGVPVIEDAAESLGSTYHGKASGTFGKFGIYSFNGNKIITTSGGGMLLSEDAGMLKQARFLATQARDPAQHYEHSQMGYNYRLSNLLAGVGRAQLQVLNERVEARREIFATYRRELAGLPGISFMPELEGTRTNRWLTALTLDEREAGLTSPRILQALHEENIEARPVWKPLHRQPLLAGSRYYRHEGRSVSDDLFATGLCLPSGSGMLEVEQQRVISCIRRTMNAAVQETGSRCIASFLPN
ncbi:aminotransferase class I/II-fold pyridoxal phosphate-dependent enzyme [Paenibacillus nasutitermitis]|uniref:Pyridoxal phosphate-dependent aminotransferase EpsN n=1 Tax=Paenibacillus nasutitermitis TaxID=1652958 RepID=A0A916Z2R5_9BACL|nr:aminotransferase class I/II-fold pyridoxal phosphate-dependent enzyme [Paenibacillus nasutitermitis]GGD73301.1 putative pyridoxal phosphate-dependent aminotransferase EpsN [Paenibacillus nasutitermitis]